MTRQSVRWEYLKTNWIFLHSKQSFEWRTIKLKMKWSKKKVCAIILNVCICHLCTHPMNHTQNGPLGTTGYFTTPNTPRIYTFFSLAIAFLNFHLHHCYILCHYSNLNRMCTFDRHYNRLSHVGPIDWRIHVAHAGLILWKNEIYRSIRLVLICSTFPEDWYSKFFCHYILTYKTCITLRWADRTYSWLNCYWSNSAFNISTWIALNTWL